MNALPRLQILDTKKINLKVKTPLQGVQQTGAEVGKVRSQHLDIIRAAEPDVNTAAKSVAEGTKQAHSKNRAAIGQASKKRKLSQVVPTAALEPLSSGGRAPRDLAEERITADVSNDDLAEVKKSKKQKRKEEKGAQQRRLDTAPEFRPGVQKTTPDARASQEPGSGGDPIVTDEAIEAHGSALAGLADKSKTAVRARVDRPKRRVKEGKDPVAMDAEHDSASIDVQHKQRGMRAIQTIISDIDNAEGLAPAWQ